MGRWKNVGRRGITLVGHFRREKPNTGGAQQPKKTLAIKGRTPHPSKGTLQRGTDGKRGGSKTWTRNDKKGWGKLTNFLLP